MEHDVIEPRRDPDSGEALGRRAHKFYKFDLLKVKKGSRAGTIAGNYISARIEVGDGKLQVHAEDLERLLETGEPIIRTNTEGNRVDLKIELGGGSDQWKPAEIQEIIDTVKPKRGRPKGAKSTDSGDESASTGSTGSKGNVA